MHRLATLILASIAAAGRFPQLDPDHIDHIVEHADKHRGNGSTEFAKAIAAQAEQHAKEQAALQATIDGLRAELAAKSAAHVDAEAVTAKTAEERDAARRLSLATVDDSDAGTADEAEPDDVEPPADPKAETTKIVRSKTAAKPKAAPAAKPKAKRK